MLGSCAVGLIVGSLSVGAVSMSAPALACPYGTMPSHFEGVCVAGQSRGGGPQSVAPQTGNSGSGGANITGGVGSLQSVNGIPCTPQHIGTCIGLIQSQQ